MSDLRYPIGRFTPPAEYHPGLRAEFIRQLADLPGELRKAVRGLSTQQLETPYRDGGWTVAQVVHHLPDSHMNSYVRMRMALTEDTPTIKPYAEERWATLADARTPEIEVSLVLVDALHQRWVKLLNTLAPEDFAKSMRHPERGLVTLDRTLATYAWHSRHHVAHIVSLRVRNGWA